MGENLLNVINELNVLLQTESVDCTNTDPLATMLTDVTNQLISSLRETTCSKYGYKRHICELLETYSSVVEGTAYQSVVPKVLPSLRSLLSEINSVKRHILPETPPAAGQVVEAQFRQLFVALLEFTMHPEQRAVQCVTLVSELLIYIMKAQLLSVRCIGDILTSDTVLPLLSQLLEEELNNDLVRRCAAQHNTTGCVPLITYETGSISGSDLFAFQVGATFVHRGAWYWRLEERVPSPLGSFCWEMIQWLSLRVVECVQEDHASCLIDLCLDCRSILEVCTQPALMHQRDTLREIASHPLVTQNAILTSRVERQIVQHSNRLTMMDQFRAACEEMLRLAEHAPLTEGQASPKKCSFQTMMERHPPPVVLSFSSQLLLEGQERLSTDEIKEVFAEVKNGYDTVLKDKKEKLNTLRQTLDRHLRRHTCAQAVALRQICQTMRELLQDRKDAPYDRVMGALNDCLMSSVAAAEEELSSMKVHTQTLVTEAIQKNNAQTAEFVSGKLSEGVLLYEDFTSFDKLIIQ
ncbi:hypothetical protein ADEAN_000444300 [Angomonas deanei]|uniref:Uncharacterized protein n=1 Tax=Angomonas deanei TaxID=59799 RepID=A0A7G2CBY9_9TRYP|nr:hypothetical protein ADEAN_000444300 [Angomonas deanei]